MKAVILAGGFGTRISEETGIRPKPMVEIGGKPVLWHVMKIYASYGITEFIVLCGYKGHMIKEYFQNEWLRTADVTFDLKNHTKDVHSNGAENWKVTLVETGEKAMTGGRVKMAEKYIGNEPFCLTYGDGLSDVNIKDLVAFHDKNKKEKGALATVTVVQPPGRFGLFQLNDGDDIVESFKEKPKGDGGGWINGGFFVCEPEVLNYIKDEFTTWEQEPMINLAHEGKLAAFRHEGFWHPMDTLHDRNVLEEKWKSGTAPWKVWK
ncbi:glucose-1-phosphate cytidylyltransferase [Candidatus Roizmanbacteria bacterium]|nr:MAG: glucose-1-phosphate cytidylyltransferase [Candidatus Roizmanbacteria bacterium]